jgi:ribonuclease VapC
VIVVDASAVLAIYFEEAEGPDFRRIIRESGGGRISPVNWWEVLVRAHVAYDEPGAAEALELMGQLNLTVAPIGGDEALLAYRAFASFGKGIGGPLNLGDCFAYALAETEGDGLLFKGGDFLKTDVKPAI